MPKRKAPTSSPSPAAATPDDANDSNNKKVGADSDEVSDGSATPSKSKVTDEPPPYGSQEYWEKRYAESASAGHSWYFTYDELRPLLLPLLLGRDTEQQFSDGDDDDDDEGEYEEYDDDDEEEDDEPPVVEEPEKAKVGEENEESSKVLNDQDQAEMGSEGNIDDANRAAPQEDHPPKSVLEVGCGDVPLGHALLLDLLAMQRQTGADANLVCDEIVCNDYAKSVINVLRDRQIKHWASGGVKGSYESAEGRDGRKVERLVLGDATEANKDPTEKPTLDVTYVVEDARDMAYKDGSFDLIIDKGTTDALLSDKKEGVSNCVKVVSEMGRCVTIGGYVVVVSHMNAHIPAGIEWCDQVLVAGLRASGADASWEIEIHGRDGSADVVCAQESGNDEKDEHKEDDDGSGGDDEAQSPGPAVYIIHKLPSKRKPRAAGENEEEEKGSSKKGKRQEEAAAASTGTITLKFFTY